MTTCIFDASAIVVFCQAALYDGLAALRAEALRLAKKSARYQAMIDQLFLLSFNARQELSDESDSEANDDNGAQSHSNDSWTDSADSDNYVEVPEQEEEECSPW